MRLFISKLKASFDRRRYLYLVIPALVFVIIIIPSVAPANAQFGWIKTGLEGVVQGVAMAVAVLLGVVIDAIMWLFLAVAQYDGFATAPAIGLGWALMRDLCNMVIVVYLLYFAFRYALGKEHGGMDTTLAKLVLVAIAINFSKTLTLMLVDISQVVMMTFVNSFKNIGVTELYRIMNVGSFFKNASDPNYTPPQKDFGGSVATIFFTIIIMLVVMAVLILLMAILLIRVIYIWILIILSPLYVAGFGIELGPISELHSKWWSKMKNLLLIGPCLTFFIWLTFAAFQTATKANGASQIIPDDAKLAEYKQGAQDSSYLGDLATPDKLAGLVVAVALLLGGVSICAEFTSGMAGMGGIGKKLGGLQGQALQFMRQTPAALGRFAGDVTVGASRRLGASQSRMLRGGGRLLGGAVRTGKWAGELLEKPGRTVKTVAGGVYKQAVRAEKGSISTAFESLRKEEFDDVYGKYSKENMSDDKLRDYMEKIKTNSDPTLNYPEKMALAKLAMERKVVTKPEEFESLYGVLRKEAAETSETLKPGSASFFKKYAGDMRKGFYHDPKSPFAVNLEKVDANGNLIIDVDAAARKANEMGNGVNQYTASQVDLSNLNPANFLKDGRYHLDDVAMTQRKTYMMAFDPGEWHNAKISQKDKEKLGGMYDSFMTKMVDKDGNSTMTKEEAEKSIQMMAALAVPFEKNRSTKETQTLIDQKAGELRKKYGIDQKKYRDPNDAKYLESQGITDASGVAFVNYATNNMKKAAQPSAASIASEQARELNVDETRRQNLEAQAAGAAAAPEASAAATTDAAQIKEIVQNVGKTSQDKDSLALYRASQNPSSNPKMASIVEQTRQTDEAIKGLAQAISANPGGVYENQVDQYVYGDAGAALTGGDANLQAELANSLKSLSGAVETYRSQQPAVQTQKNNINVVLRNMGSAAAAPDASLSQITEDLKKLAQQISTNQEAPMSTTNGLTTVHGAVLDAISKIESDTSMTAAQAQNLISEIQKKVE